MKILNSDISNEVIELYCRIIIKLENNYSPELEKIRSKLHDKIFMDSGHYRSLYRRKDRKFSIELNKTVSELIARDQI